MFLFLFSSLLFVIEIVYSAAKTHYMPGGIQPYNITFRGTNGFASGVAAQRSQDYSAWYGSIPGLTMSMKASSSNLGPEDPRMRRRSITTKTLQQLVEENGALQAQVKSLSNEVNHWRGRSEKADMKMKKDKAVFYKMQRKKLESESLDRRPNEGAWTYSKRIIIRYIFRHHWTIIATAIAIVALGFAIATYYKKG